PNAHEVRFEIVPGGHLGMLTGRAARTSTWIVMDEWIEQYSTPDNREAATSVAAKIDRASPAAKKAPSQGSSVTAQRSAIGSNPTRRYRSASSRNLAGGAQPPSTSP